MTSWHDAFVLPYTGYLRVYEPLSAFPAARAEWWAAYAASADRPRRAGALAAEQAEALRRMTALPPVAAPERESDDAYVRWAEGVTYVCPWQTRLRSWLALARLRETEPALLWAAFPGADLEAAADALRGQQGTEPLRVYIQASNWSVPPEWFVPFAPDERWLVLGPDGETPADPGDGGRATAAATRALVYATTMAQARRRVARAIGAARRAEGIPVSGHLIGGSPLQMLASLEPIGRWLEEFHPHALVELDYGGLVHLFTDGALQADQSVAEVAAAVSALSMNEIGLAVAMHRRVTRRWRALTALSLAS